MELLEIAQETDETLNAVALYSTEDAIHAFLRKIRAEAESHVPDVSNSTGRKAIASLAYKISRTKTAADEAGKALVEAERAKIDIMNAHRRTIRETLDALRDHVREPLDQWEDAEKKRVDACKAMIERLKRCELMPAGTPASELEGELIAAEAITISMPAFADFVEEATSAKERAIAALKIRIEAERKAEADRAELERLRAEAAERARVDAEAKAKAEADAREKVRQEEERRAAERKREEEALRIKEAEDRARRDAEDRAKKEHEAEIARVRAEEEAKVRQAEAVAAQIKKEAEDRAAQEAARKVEEDRRARDAAHRKACRDEAVEAIRAASCISTSNARMIFDAIAAGTIPHLFVKF